MIPARFDYTSPAALDEAIALLDGEEAKVLSGGQSLIPLLKLRLGHVRLLVDINRIPGLDTIAEADGALRIGALVRESDIERSDVVASRYPILADTARVVADPIVRNRATLCGNVAHADPANDHPATLLALGASVVARGSGGERVLPIDGFFTSIFETALNKDEIVTEIRIPAPRERTGGAYFKLERKVGDFATAAVAVQLALAADGYVESAGIGLTNVGPMPILARRAAESLTGRQPNDAAIEEAARIASEEAQPSTDRRGSAEYKRDLVRILAARAIRRALERAGSSR